MAAPTIVVPGVTPSGTLLAHTAYRPSGSTTYARSSATFAEVDPTNLTVTFTVPASGKVLICLSANCLSTNSNTYVQWGVGLSGGSVVPNTRNLITHETSEACQTMYTDLSGLTPGAVVTYSWFWACFSNTSPINMYSGDGSAGEGPAVMSVWAA